MEHIQLSKITKDSELRLLSYVRLSESEKVLINPDKEKNKYIAVRTNKAGCSVKSNKTVFQICENAVFITSAKNSLVISNDSNAKANVFFFKSDRANCASLQDRILKIANTEWEEKQNELIELCLKSKNENSALLLNSIFNAIYYNWAFSMEAQKNTPKLSNSEIEKAVKYISENLDRKINMKELSKAFNYSERNFRKLFKEETGMSPKTYHQELRLAKAQQLLSDSDMTISEISEELGFYSQFQFSSVFKMKFGITPSQYKLKMK